MIALTDQDQMPFGKFGPKGEDPRIIEKVPAKYLLFLWDKFLWNADEQGREDYWLVACFVRENFNLLETEASDYIIAHRPEGK